MMKKIFILVFVSIHLMCYSQSRYGIKSISAFRTERQPGNIPVDDGGKPVHKGPDTSYTIFIETSGKQITWQSAWCNGKQYSISTGIVAGNTVEVGVKKNSKERITLTAAPGNKLWQLDLAPEEKSKPSPVRAKPHEIILKGTYRGKTVIQKINDQIELAVFPSV